MPNLTKGAEGKKKAKLVEAEMRGLKSNYTAGQSVGLELVDLKNKKKTFESPWPLGTPRPTELVNDFLINRFGGHFI